MDWTAIIIGFITAFGGGGLAYVLFYRQERAKRVADTGKVTADASKISADAESVTVATLTSIIAVLRGEVDRISARVVNLERRVTALETENRTLTQQVDRFRLLVKRLWALVCEAQLDADDDLVEAVFEALEDSAA